MAAQALANYQKLAGEIKKGNIAPLYLLHGEEQVLAENVVEMLVERLVPKDMQSLNFQPLDGQKLSVAELAAAVQTPPMFGQRRLVVVNQPWFLTGKQDGQEEKLGRLFDHCPEFTCLVLLSAGLDKRLKLVKQLSRVASVYEFSALTAGEAAQWVDDRLRRAGIAGFGFGKLVVARAGNSLRILRLEVEKISAYAKDSAVTAADVAQLVRNDVETSVFDLVDAIGQRHLEQALQLLDQLQAEGQAPLYILTMIGRQLRLLMLARMQLDLGASDQLAAKALGIHPYPAGKCVMQARLWSQTKLRQAIASTLAADEAIKTGQLSDRRALDRLLLELA